LQKPRPRDNGFTLVEILVTLFIFGVIAGTLFTAYRALFFDTERFKQTTRNYARAQVAVQRIMADLLAIRVTLPPTYTPPQGDDPPDPLRLTGQTEPASPRSGITWRKQLNGYLFCADPTSSIPLPRMQPPATTQSCVRRCNPSG